MKSSALLFVLTLALVPPCSAADRVTVQLQQRATVNVPKAEGLPEPPEGFRWVLNEAFSDEFNGTELDATKWHDHNPHWVGRPPGKFMPESVSVSGGHLRISSTPLKEPDDTFTIACGAVQSKSDQALYGYYECRMKASSSRTSSTFWLTSKRGKPSSYGTLSLELDIQESIGAAKRWKSFATDMKYNTHIKLYPNELGKAFIEERAAANPLSEAELAKLAAMSDEEREKKLKRIEHDRFVLQQGGGAPLRSNVDEEFHTYGCWWVDANTMHFYADGEHIGTVEPETDFDPTPFDHPMMMNLVCETYAWESVPTEEQLTNPALNTTRYDYVRSYQLEPIE